jgi:multiple sugar transport system substrate-binding protein
VGARLLFVRRPLLERAGVDPETAFGTAAQLEHTLSRLRAAGVEVPWTVPTGQTHTTLLNVASWVWGAGGDFITPDGRQTLFSQLPARAGLRAYFALGRYLAPAVRHFRSLQSDEQFWSDPQTAVTISGSWLFETIRAANLTAQIGVAPPPGPPFVGGSHLVIWKHAHQPDAALDLVRFLTQPAAQADYGRRAGLLPANREALAEAPFADDPLWQQEIACVKAGRGFPVTRSWGLVEYRLVATFSALWSETLANPNLDLDAALAKHLAPLAQRLDALLGQA